jgi:type I site-specific restriction endonuclease
MIPALPLSEADTRAKLIDPAIHACGWSEDLICRETTRARSRSSPAQHADAQADAPTMRGGFA